VHAGALAELNCPANRRVGSTSAATPLLANRLRGGVYLVSRPRGLPALAAVLQAQITVVLQGESQRQPAQQAVLELK
jgi:hypothetical protein